MWVQVIFWGVLGWLFYEAEGEIGLLGITVIGILFAISKQIEESTKRIEAAIHAERRARQRGHTLDD